MKKSKSPSQHLRMNLRPLLERAEMSRYEFAEKSGMNYVSVSDLINGKYKRIGIDTLEKICRTLDVDVGELFVWD